jgi:hypothetical protein
MEKAWTIDRQICCAVQEETVEGHYYWVIYYANDGIKLPSGLQVVRNYANAATAIGGKKVYEFEDGGIQTDSALSLITTNRLRKNNCLQVINHCLSNSYICLVHCPITQLAFCI